MCNSFDSVEEILATYFSDGVAKLDLTDAETYWAHTPNRFGSHPETLEEHLTLVMRYLRELVNAHQLDPVINRLIHSFINEKQLSAKMGQWLKKLFVDSILYHDHGKVNENFQANPDKMNNPGFLNRMNEENGIGTQHSTLSSFIFLNHKIIEALEIKDAREQTSALVLALIFSYPIYRHHSNFLKDDYWSKIIEDNKRADQLKDYLQLFYETAPNSQIIALLKKLDYLKNANKFKDFERSEALYQLIRLNSSLLTASDYLATNEYMNAFSIENFGILNRDRIDSLYDFVTQEEWIDRAKEKKNFNKKTYDELDAIDLNIKPTEASFVNLNLLRQQMATEAIRNLRRNSKHNLFFLEAPTGGGKTNISMLLTLELLKANKELNKVFYVFPFTTLIDQTFKSLQEGMNLADTEIIALHSKAPFFQSSSGDEVDAKYGGDKKNYIDRLFVNFHFTLLSHVRFFNILKTNLKEENYLLHRLANSVVVIDELQSYNPDHWDKLLYFIQNFADIYNIRFIVMSATLPKISKLEIDGLGGAQFVNLLSKAKEDYFHNPNFAGRVKFDYSLGEARISLDALAQTVLKESKIYSAIDGGRKKPKGSVFTVIEFIFKHPTTLFEREIQKINDDFFDEIFVLSGSILPHRRKFIINFLKNPDNRSKRILLITTQVVEAGVDIDMDLGFKDSSILDSDEQLAGRINRNVSKIGCKLFLYNYSREARIYGKDLRYQLTKELNSREKRHILETKDFDYLYQKVIDFKNRRNKDANFVGIEDYRICIKNLQFEKVAKEFKIIEQENLSLFIPLKIPIFLLGETGENEDNFTKTEFAFLRQYQIIPDENNLISGEEIFDLYLSINTSFMPFIEKRIAIKHIQALLSKFTISIFSSKKNQEKFTEFSDLEKSENGYLYMEHWEKFYSELSGINEGVFEDIENQFI